MRKEILRMNHVSCSENGMPILNDLSLQVFEGEIFGILRLERHGGAELFHFIAWNDPIESGQVFFREQLVNDLEKSDGSRNKVAVIDSTSRLIGGLSLADNLFVIRPGFHKFLIPERVLKEQTRLLLAEYGICLPLDGQVDRFSPYDRLVAELLRAVVAGERLVLLMDIPDLLGSGELQEFHRLVRQLAGRGMTFLYVYNHHEALRRLCDRIAIFKEGRVEKIIEKGDDLERNIRIFAKDAYEAISLLKPSSGEESDSDKATVLRFEHVSRGRLRDFSMRIRADETQLLLDRDNAALDDLLEVFTDLNQGRHVAGVTAPGGLKALRLGLIQRSPTRTTLYPDLSFLDNLCFPLGEKVPSVWLKRRLRRSVAGEFRRELGAELDEPSLYYLHTQELYTLAYYRWLIAKPDLVVCIQPLSGQDMYLRPHILRLIARLRANGIPVLILSTDLYDTIYVTDRIFWMENGRIVQDKTSEQFHELRQLHQELFPD